MADVGENFSEWNPEPESIRKFKMEQIFLIRNLIWDSIRFSNDGNVLNETQKPEQSPDNGIIQESCTQTQKDSRTGMKLSVQSILPDTSTRLSEENESEYAVSDGCWRQSVSGATGLLTVLPMDSEFSREEVMGRSRAASIIADSYLEEVRKHYYTPFGRLCLWKMDWCIKTFPIIQSRRNFCEIHEDVSYVKRHTFWFTLSSPIAQRIISIPFHGSLLIADNNNFYIPEMKRWHFMTHCHEHYHAWRTPMCIWALDALKEQFWRLGIGTWCDEFCAQCEICQINDKIWKPQTSGPLMQLEACETFETIITNWNSWINTFNEK